MMKTVFIRIGAAILGLALAGIACSALSGSNYLYSDDFSDSNSGWGTGSDANKSVDYTNNTLEFQVFKADDFVYSTPNDTNYQNVHLDVTATANQSDGNTAFGILCDQQVTPDAFYYFGVTPNGQYAIARAAVAKDDVFLTKNAAWESSDLIPKNATSYTVGADCSQNALTLYVDGKQIDSVTDATYTSGHFGLFVWSDKKANSADINFDDFKATQLK
jgi:hypothetical protein